MAKFKNKKTGAIIEENLIYYVNRMRNNNNFVEVNETKENPETPTEKIKKEEVENTPQ